MGFAVRIRATGLRRLSIFWRGLGSTTNNGAMAPPDSVVVSCRHHLVECLRRPARVRFDVHGQDELDAWLLDGARALVGGRLVDERLAAAVGGRRSGDPRLCAAGSVAERQDRPLSAVRVDLYPWSGRPVSALLAGYRQAGVGVGRRAAVLAYRANGAFATGRPV